jgi:hypothetical protein
MRQHIEVPSSFQFIIKLSLQRLHKSQRIFFLYGKPKITINVPLFKKLRDIIFFWWENHFMSHFEGHFEGAKTFLTP